MRSRRIMFVVSAIAATLLISAVASAIPFDPPANDDVADATVAASLPFTAMQTNEGATKEDGAYVNCNTPAEETVWFIYTADSTEALLYEASGDDFYPRVYTYKGSPGVSSPAELTPLNYCGQSSGVLNIVAGTTYYFQVASYVGDAVTTGDFTFRLNPLDNGDFADAETLDGLPAYARGANYTDGGMRLIDEQRAPGPGPITTNGLEEGEPQPCGAIGLTVWYRIDLEVDAPMTANTFDVSNDLGPLDLLDGAGRTNFDTVLAVYSGPSDATFADLVLLGCNDDTGQGVSRVDFDGTTGTTYYFQVGGYDAVEYYYGPSDAIASGPAGLFDLTVSALCKDQPATIVGTNGHDVLTGGDGRDIIAGLGGNDTLNGLAGRDTLCGGPGRDLLRGGGGGDKLLGQSGRDMLFGNRGNDGIWGGSGLDEADGGPANDRCRTEIATACEA